MKGQAPKKGFSCKDDGREASCLLKNKEYSIILKPFDLDEVLVRIEVILRRSGIKEKTGKKCVHYFKRNAIAEAFFRTASKNLYEGKLPADL